MTVADVLQVCCKCVANLLHCNKSATKSERRERVRVRDRDRLSPYIPLRRGKREQKVIHGGIMKTPTTDRYKYRRTPVKNRNTNYETGYYALAAAIVKKEG